MTACVSWFLFVGTSIILLTSGVCTCIADILGTIVCTGVADISGTKVCTCAAEVSGTGGLCQSR